MKRYRAVVRNGRLVLDVPCDLPDGSSVELVGIGWMAGCETEDPRALSAALSKSAEDAVAGRWVGESEMRQRLQGR